MIKTTVNEVESVNNGWKYPCLVMLNDMIILAIGEGTAEYKSFEGVVLDGRDIYPDGYRSTSFAKNVFKLCPSSITLRNEV